MVRRLDTSLEVTNRELPEFGVCISIGRKAPKVETFRYVEHGSQRFLLGREGGEIYEVEKIQTPKQLAAFLRSYLIFALDP
jgi:hypothetical protein